MSQSFSYVKNCHEQETLHDRHSFVNASKLGATVTLRVIIKIYIFSFYLKRFILFSTLKRHTTRIIHWIIAYSIQFNCL